MKKLILLIAIAILLGSCITRQKCESMFPPKVTTSNDTIVKYVERNTVEHLPADSSLYYAYIDCINGKPVITEVSTTSSGNGRAPVISHTFKGNKLTVKCKEDSLRKVIKTLEKQVQINSSKVEVHETKVNFITGWQNFQMWCGRILFGLIVAAVVYMWVKTKGIKL